MKIPLVNYQTVHTALFKVTILTENEVNIKGYILKQPKILLYFSSQKNVNETESGLLFQTNQFIAGHSHGKNSIFSKTF